MTFEDVRRKIGHIPHTPPEDGKILFDFILRNNCRQILELGFEHGTSTCYMAAALQELGGGHVVTIDREETLEVKPSVHDLLSATGLTEFVEPVFARRTYIWELMKLIEQHSVNGRCEPVFDFCFIDGAHTFEVDGFAFFLVEKLLKPGGWVLFDDLFWSFGESKTLQNTDWVRQLPEEERTTPQIERVFTLLVSQHPQFHNFKIHRRWGWAQKKADDRETAAQSIDSLYYQQSFKPDIIYLLKKFKYRLLHLGKKK